MDGRTLAAASILLALALTACGSSQSAAPTATIPPAATKAPQSPGSLAILVTDVGGLHDRSFNDMAWAGMQAVARHTKGLKVKVVQSSSVGDYQRNLRQAASQPNLLIVAVGGSMGQALYAVANQFARQQFALVDARPQDTPGHEVNVPNVANLLFREQDAGYLAGVIAGLMEKDRVGKAVHNTIGYLGGQPMAPVDHYLAGYVAGAQSVDPRITVVGDYAGTFTDPQAGRSIAGRQANEGADIFFQVAAETGSGYLDAIKQRGLYGIGVDADQRYLGKNIITSAVKRVDVAVAAVLEEAIKGKFRPYDHLLGAAQGGVGFAAPSSVVPPRFGAQARNALHQIATGKIVPPTSIPAH